MDLQFIILTLKHDHQSTVDVSQSTHPRHYIGQICTIIDLLWMCPKPHTQATIK